jgi:hypothetical protein
VFLVNTEKVSKPLYSTIFSSYNPIKIILNSNDIFKIDIQNINSIYDISLILKIFYKSTSLSLEEIIGTFTKSIKTTERNILLYNLFNIKNRLNTVIERHRLMTLLKTEQRIKNIVFHIEKIGVPYSRDLFDSTIGKFNTKYTETKNLLSSNFNLNFDNLLTDKTELIKALTVNKLSITANYDYLSNIPSKKDILLMIMTHDTLNKYKNDIPANHDNERIYINYDSYNKFGNLEPSFEIDNFYISASNDKKLVVGSYDNLYYRIFANTSHIPYIIEFTNNNMLLDSLTTKVFNVEENSDITPTIYQYYRFLTMALLNAHIRGYMDADLIADYTFNELHTIISAKDWDKSLGKFQNKCPEIIEFCQSFNKCISKDKRKSLIDDTSLHNYIKLTESDIMKNLLIQVDNDLLEFNSTNKYRIDLISVSKNAIVLELDSKNLNIGIDILSRHMNTAHSKYIKKIKSMYNVYSSNSMKPV